MDTRSTILRHDDGARLVLQRALLVVVAGPEEGLEHELTERPVVLGRDESADLVLDDPTVSREHARLEPREEGWTIVDLGSKSGVRVNGVKVETAAIEPGQQIALGESVLVVEERTAELNAPRHQEQAFQGLVGQSRTMQELFGLVKKVGPLDLPVLLVGAPGTGKERLARAVHAHGPAPSGPYEVVDCTLLGQGEHMRSELFGHVKGAFTGADQDRSGAFERAHGGTLFLDEIGELPLELQPQLLRVLQEGEVRPLGGSSGKRVRTRVVGATNRDVPRMIREGRFRADLYHRLAAITLDVPPLRARGDDVLLLARGFLPEGVTLDASAEAALRAHSWPGNVRELEFTIQKAAALCDGGTIRAADLQLGSAPVVSPDGLASEEALESHPGAHHLRSGRQRAQELEEADILDALARCDGNRNEAAKLLGIGRATLFRKLKKMRDEDEG